MDPMLRSGLVFAGEGDDARLTAEEVALLDLRGTELVVLSACETALGDRTLGEGVHGLQRGFAVAGAQSVVMTLWAVPDAVTSQLMAGFYRRLLRRRDPLTPVAALREAQLELLGERRQRLGESRPQDWAAFLASGVSGTGLRD